MKTNIGLTDKKLKHSTDILTKLLANEMTLYVKTRKAHWNVEGESFMELHRLFQDEYKQLEEWVDEVAERIGKLGEKTIGTMQEYLKHASIKEHADKYESSKDVIKELMKDHECIIIEIRNHLEESKDKGLDFGTADFITGLMEFHESTAWILRRYLN